MLRVGLFVTILLHMTFALAAEHLLEARAKVYSWPGESLLFQDLLRDNAAKSQLDAKTLSQVVLPGERVSQEAFTLGSRELSKMLRTALKENSNKHVQFQLPEELKVEPAPQKLLESRLVTDLIKSLQKNCDCRVELSKLHLQWPESITPQTTWSWETLPSADDLRGSLFVGLDIHVGTQHHRRWVQAQTRVLRRVPVATRSINYGEKFTEENVREDWRDVSYSRAESMTPEEMAGYSSNRMIPLGQVIQRRDLVMPKVVKFGDTVRVYKSTGPLEVTVTGVAQQAGAIGDMIKVKIAPTDKLVSAQIVESGKVRIQ
jgi:flagella basal body P-ring formation protein FlgA